jgi:hypothetical protein
VAARPLALRPVHTAGRPDGGRTIRNANYPPNLGARIVQPLANAFDGNYVRLMDAVRSFQDHFDDGVRLREHGTVARVQLDRVRAHAF